MAMFGNSGPRMAWMGAPGLPSTQMDFSDVMQKPKQPGAQPGQPATGAPGEINMGAGAAPGSPRADALAGGDAAPAQAAGGGGIMDTLSGLFGGGGGAAAGADAAGAGAAGGAAAAGSTIMKLLSMFL